MSFPAAITFPVAAFSTAQYDLAPPHIPLYFYFEGDSHTSGSEDYPYALATKSNFNSGLTYRNVAASGETAAQMVGQFATEIAPYLPEGGRKFFFLLAGTNDVAGSGDSAATMFANLSALWASARAAGMWVVAFTVPPISGLSGAREAARSALNVSIAAAIAEWDHLVRPDQLFPDPDDLANYSDGTHFTPTAVETLATWINDNIDPLA